LYEDGKVLSEKERLTMVVMGTSSAFRHVLSKKVGMMSSEHEESEERLMASRTSSRVAGRKEDKVGGAGFGGGSGMGTAVGEKVADSLTILSWKKFINDEANVEAEVKVGKVLGECRQSKVSRHDQSFFGCFAQFVISDLKWERRAEVMSLASTLAWFLKL
jgi:hypothetical protein